MIKVSQILLLLTLGLIPLLPAGSRYGYEHIKVIFLIILVTISAVIFLIYSLKTGSKLQFQVVHKISAGFLLVLFITSVLGLNSENSLLGVSPYFQGFLTYLYLFILSLLVTWTKLPLKWSIWALIISSGLVGVISIIQWISLDVLKNSIPNYSGRVVSTFGQPNFYAGFLLLNLPLVWWLRLGDLPAGRQGSGRLAGLGSASWRIGVLGIMIMGILVSFSKTAIFLLVFLIVWLLSAKLKFQKPILGVFMIVVLLASLVSINYLSSGFLWQETTQIQDLEWLSHNSPEKRALIWPVFLNQIGNSPVTGYGLENIPAVFAAYQPSDPVPAWYYSLKDIIVDRSHNYFLDILLFSGVLGLIMYLILTFKLLKVTRRTPLLISLIIYLIWVQFQNQSIVQLIWFWWLVGMTSQKGLNLDNKS